MKLRQYQVDAFADKLFSGNPAAVCPLDSWLDEGLLQAIAAENNLSETAFFAPKCGIPEDPVAGSAHGILTPYWSKQLGKQRLAALQVSKRGGRLDCEMRGDRVRLSGGAVVFMRAEIEVPCS